MCGYTSRENRSECINKKVNNKIKLGNHKEDK